MAVFLVPVFVPRAPRLAGRAPMSRENKAELTLSILDPVRGEIGADFCLPGKQLDYTEYTSGKHARFLGSLLSDLIIRYTDHLSNLSP